MKPERERERQIKRKRKSKRERERVRATQREKGERKREREREPDRDRKASTCFNAKAEGLRKLRGCSSWFFLDINVQKCTRGTKIHMIS